MLDEEKERSKAIALTWVSLFVKGATSLVFVLFVQWLWPGTIPFSTFGFWMGNKILEGVAASWPVFLWGGAITAIHAFATRNKPEVNRNAESLLAGGFILSAGAGLFEEVIFRWLIFFSGIVGVKVANFLFFGWLGFGIAEWFHMHLYGPVVNFLTLGKMEWLVFGHGWAVGAATIAANAKFREAHKYLGPLGYANSWILGFFFFWVMFNFGLLAVIIVHFLYDMIIFAVRYLDAVIERARQPDSAA